MSWIIVHVKNLKDRKTYDIKIERTQYADDIKAELEKQADIPMNAQRLVFAGRPMASGKTLSEMGIQKGSTLHLVPSLHGDNEAERAKVYGMAGSLYALCGGIFGVVDGVAAFADRSIFDVFYPDPVLITGCVMLLIATARR